MFAATARHLPRSARALSTSAVRNGNVFIASAARTPIGSFQGMFSSLSAVELGVVAATGAIQRSGLDAAAIQECYFGNVLSAGLGQAPARQVALGAGCELTTGSTTINKVCASGMKAIMLAAQNIALGAQDVMLAGGMESMSNAPYISRTARGGNGYGHKTLEDLILSDGLTDVYQDFHMGMCGEICAEQYDISRAEQDAYALQSYHRSAAAGESGRFAREIVPVTVKSRAGEQEFDQDEEYRRVNEEKIPKLRTVFKKDGTVTAANASKINDGAAALVLVSEDVVKANNLSPIARIAGFADAARISTEFTVAPADAIPKALARAGVAQEDIALWEINEAFSVVALANQKILGLDPAKVNAYGGAVALGHPIGMSGARIVGSLAHQLEPGQFGCASICNGGGGASAIVVERL
eukprot:m.40111 g.40111  ORF g.40111 m.40111 type:complete len:412 (-) comp11336_c0_seq1:88-1323(-)